MEDKTGLLHEVDTLLRDLHLIQDRLEQIQRRLVQEEPLTEVLDFMSRCCVEHPIRGDIPLELFDYQVEMIMAFEDHKNVIVKKARQMGLTTIMALYALYLAATRPNYNVVIMANNIASSMEMLRRMTFAARSPHLRLPFTTEMTPTTLKFANGSSITCHAVSKKLEKAQSVDCIIIDEMAQVSYKTMDDAWTQLLPKLRACSKIILSSTPRFSKGLFYNLWKKAPEAGFTPLSYDWTRHPHRDEKWRDVFRGHIGEKNFQTEFEAQFIDEDLVGE